MFELPFQSIEKIRPLIRGSGMHGHLALVYEVIEGRRPGQVFVDQPGAPRTALLCSSSGFFFAFGEPDERLLNDLIRHYWKSGPDMNYTTLFGSHPDWYPALQRAFAPYNARCEKRLAFELRSMPPEPAVPEGFSMEPITARLAQSILDGSGTGGYGIDPWFVRTWGGAEAYEALGLGLALLKDGQIASLAGVCGLGNGEAELEIGTVPAFRGRSLAAIVSAAFMHQCQSRGLLPAYSCTSDNYPSISVAHRLGYAEFEEIQGYRLSSG